jgi:hypothetical protein
LLTDEVDLELSGGSKAKPVEQEKKPGNDFFEELESAGKGEDKKV